MAKNKIITSQGNVQFINSKGRTINVHPWHVYSVYEGDTVSFLFVYMKDYSGQAIFASQYEDLEVNGETYDNMDDLKDALSYAFAKAGAQARTEIVTELPEDPYTNTIYLLPKEHGEGFDEYIWNEDEGWQLIGDTDVEWERYLKIADFNEYSAATAEEIAYISGAVDTNAADIVALSGAIDTEIAAREAADTYISGAVDTVSTDLATESQRAVSAETALGNRIDSANARIDAEQTSRALADTFISGAVDTEVSNRISADTALQSAIDNEASSRTDADSALSDKIDYVSGAVDTVSSDLSSEVSRAQGAESALNTKVNALSGAIDSVDDKVDALSGEVQTMGDEAIVDAEYVSSSTTIDFYNASGDVVAQVDATDFIKDGMIEDVRIENGYLIIDFNTASGIEDIEIPLTDIFDPSNYYDKTAIDGIVSGINDDIADEVSARTDADAALQNVIDIVSGNVETEASRAESAETALQTAIDNEVSARTEAISGLTDRLGEDEEVWGAALNDLNSDISALTDSLSAYSTTVEMNAAIDAATSGKLDTNAFETYSGNVNTTLGEKQNSSNLPTWIVSDWTYDKNTHKVSVAKILKTSGGGMNSTHTVITINNQDIFNNSNVSNLSLVETSAITSAVTSASTDSEIPTAKAVYDAIPTVPTSNTAFTNDAGYITVDALSGYAESSAVTEEITAAVSSKQDTLVAGENITISGNVISASGGGTTYSAGRGIDITNDTISFSLPIYDKRNYSISECHDKIYDIPSCSSNYCHLEQSKGGIGYSSHSSHKEGLNTIIGNYCYSSHVEGYFSKINDDSAYSHAEGYYTEINNQREHASGSHNVSNKASTTFGDSGNTLFSVGNGTADNARHNAFEIRQNGDIYLNDGTNDVKLQDYIQIKVAKISQSDYDALVQGGTTDANTLYIISD